MRALGLLLLAGCSWLIEETTPPPTDAGVAPAVDGGSADPCDPNPCHAQRRSVCEAADGLAVCACDEGSELVGEHCLPVEECDDGDCMGGAIPIARGEAIEGGLNRDGGNAEDWYIVEAPSRGGIERIVVELIGDSGPDAPRGEGEVPQLLPNMALFVAPDLDAPARVLPRDDAPEDGRFHRQLSAHVPAGAVLLLRISDADPAPVHYRVRVEATVDDDYPNGVDGAPSVATGDQAFSLETREDVDVMVIEVQQSGALVLGISLDQPARDAAGVSLRVATEGSNDARRYWGRARHPVGPGRIVVRIDHPAGHLVSGTLHSTLLEGDDHGDRPEAATPTEAGNGAVLLGTISEGDQDWFAFPAVQGAVYRIAYSGDGTIEGQRAGAEAMSWSGAMGEYYRHDGHDGDALLRISGPQHDYRLMLFDTDIEDPEGNSAAAARVPGLEDQLEASIAYDGDVDFFGPFFAPDTLCAQVRPVLAMALVNGDGDVVAEAGPGGALSHSLESGIFSLRIAAANPGQAATPIAYSLDFRCP